jgi:hypothetical protein
MVFAPDLGSQAMVVAVVTMTYSSSGTKFNPPCVSGPRFGVGGTAGHSTCVFGFHGSRVRSGGQNGHTIPYPTILTLPLTKPM